MWYKDFTCLNIYHYDFPNMCPKVKLKYLVLRDSVVEFLHCSLKLLFDSNLLHGFEWLWFRD